MCLVSKDMCSCFQHLIVLETNRFEMLTSRETDEKEGCDVCLLLVKEVDEVEGVEEEPGEGEDQVKCSYWDLRRVQNDSTNLEEDYFGRLSFLTVLVNGFRVIINLTKTKTFGRS